MNSYEELEKALSLERFSRYLDWAGGDRERAIELYTLNTALSEALYTPLQMLEVALRNRIHAVMSGAFHENWFRDESVLLGQWQPEQLAKAIKDIEQSKKEPTAGRIVAALTFSFWTAMFGKDYETLWQQTLHKVGRRMDGKGLRRKDFSGPLAQIRSLRNRIAHHEPIVMWDLRKRHASILEITGWLSPPALEWCRAHSRFESVHPIEIITLG
ncbi:Abi family protein [Azospirillum lipoferum]|uniref:Abi family protein n=1 Tax=Azospirillum lipoferum (strain 4B) TaxID=862719 RepID=G7ZGS6_AZOL4|nr:Abi family protein [Azospirillum lipoferum]CBS90500.1 conserved protein of unknown function [Azospirillum lipoferum 4B]